MLHGLLLIDKEDGLTSHDVVQRVRRTLGQKKIGHCGTLDPAATGLLVLTLGKATRLTRFLIRAPKVYEGTIRFGVTTNTYDAEGDVVAEHPADGLVDAEIHDAMRTFVGNFEQAAPPFSAKKIKGVRYYTLARRGEEVPDAKKPIQVFEFRPEERVAGSDTLDFHLECSSGTYVRSLAHDLGQLLGCGAHLAKLRRLKVGPFSVQDSITFSQLSQQEHDEDSLGAAWVPLDRVPLPFALVTADAQQERRALHGQTVLIRDVDCEEGDWIRLANNRQQLVAIGTVTERLGVNNVGVVQPRIVFR